MIGSNPPDVGYGLTAREIKTRPFPLFRPLGKGGRCASTGGIFLLHLALAALRAAVPFRKGDNDR